MLQAAPVLLQLTKRKKPSITIFSSPSGRTFNTTCLVAWSSAKTVSASSVMRRFAVTMLFSLIHDARADDQVVQCPFIGSEGNEKVANVTDELANQLRQGTEAGRFIADGRTVQVDNAGADGHLADCC